MALFISKVTIFVKQHELNMELNTSKKILSNTLLIFYYRFSPVSTQMVDFVMVCNFKIQLMRTYNYYIRTNMVDILFFHGKRKNVCILLQADLLLKELRMMLRKKSVHRVYSMRFLVCCAFQPHNYM